jgi:hypothetical protein
LAAWQAACGLHGIQKELGKDLQAAWSTKDASAATEWEFPRLMAVEAKLVVTLASKIGGYWRYPVV